MWWFFTKRNALFDKILGCCYDESEGMPMLVCAHTYKPPGILFKQEVNSMIDRFYCYQCMQEKGDSVICPHCGFIASSYEENPLFLQPGTLLNQRYLVGNILVSNQESAQYIARDQHLDTAVEIKEFLPVAIASRDADQPSVVVQEKDEELYGFLVRDFLRLNQALSKIRTIANLVQVYQLFSANGTYYAVMEHVDGVTLQKYLTDHYGELSWQETFKLFASAIQSLEKLHEMGIIHGGLSPETLYVTTKHMMKIGGFAIPGFRLKNSAVSFEVYHGYAAPEQYEPSGKNSFGPRSDVYAMAAILYRTLTGTMPTDAKSRAYMDNLILPNIVNQTIPNHISVAIMSALAISPQLRTQTMSELYADLATPPRSYIASAAQAKPAPASAPTPNEQKPEDSKKTSFYHGGCDGGHFDGGVDSGIDVCVWRKRRTERSR